MTPIDFQNALLEEIEILVKDIRTKNTAGETKCGAKGYRQQLPVIMEDEEDTSRYFPYFIVRLDSGESKDDDSPWTVTANILLGIYEDRKEADGHLHIMTMIQRITDRFLERPLLDRRYRAAQDMSWALQEEDTYPFYFGGIEMKFYIPKIGRSDGWS